MSDFLDFVILAPQSTIHTITTKSFKITGSYCNPFACQPSMFYQLVCTSVIINSHKFSGLIEYHLFTVPVLQISILDQLSFQSGEQLKVPRVICIQEIFSLEHFNGSLIQPGFCTLASLRPSTCISSISKPLRAVKNV